MRIGCVRPYFCAASLFASTPWPCLPGAPELIASQTTSGCFFAASRSDPFVCDARTNGQPGLNHSSTTVFPLKSERRTLLPSRSGNTKSGAGAPTDASVVSLGTFADVAVAGCETTLSGAGGDLLQDATNDSERPARTAMRIPGSLARAVNEAASDLAFFCAELA